MRDCLNRRGFDRVLMSVGATFLTVSTTSVLAQNQPRSSAAELAIEAAIPRPEPANVPPPTIGDFKMDTTASVPPSSKMEGVQATDRRQLKPGDTAAAAATSKDDPNKPAAKSAETSKDESTKSGTTPDATAPAMTTTTPTAEPSKEIAKEPAPEPAKEPVKAVSNVPTADQPVADRLKDVMSVKGGRYFDRKAERAAVEKFYTAREYAPLWTHAGQLTDGAKGVIARLKDAASEGLEPTDYPVPDFAGASTPDALAEADLKLTASMLDYARQAQSGRMHWSQISADIAYPEHSVDPSEVLSHISTAKDSSAALESYNPPHKLYKQLKAKLAELRGHTGGQDSEIPDGPSLKYSFASRGKKQQETAMEDARVPKLRVRLGIADAADDNHYDATVAEAVRKFQESVDLKPTGVLDDRTVRALNSPKHDRQIDTIIVNMERWRWLPRELGAPSVGDAYVILNIPDFTLKVMQHGQAIWTTRVVTGKPGVHATPLLTETMKYITVNPTWNVPPSIVYNEYLPALQQDPTVLERMGLRLERNYDGSIHISQPPGEANALGRVRFNFPNKFLVYQHDTPDKYLFDKPERAYSHGCMRVQYPDQYAAILLNITMPNEHYTPEKIRSMYGHSEIDLKFPTPIPVNITYQTAFVDEADKLQIRKDIYGRDATMMTLLRGGAHGRDLENVVAHSQPGYGRPNMPIPSGVNFASDNSYYPPGYYAGFSSGPSFFQRLFAPPTPPAPVGRRLVPPRPIYTR